jgi:hypothetical protein
MKVTFFHAEMCSLDEQPFLAIPGVSREGFRAAISYLFSAIYVRCS